MSALLTDGPAWLEYDVVLGYLPALSSRPAMTRMLWVIELPEDPVLQLAWKRGPVEHRIKCRESIDKHLEVPLLPVELTEKALER